MLYSFFDWTGILQILNYNDYRDDIYVSTKYCSYNASDENVGSPSINDLESFKSFVNN